MPIIEGFDKLDSVPEEQITDKIGRRVISGKQGTLVSWRMKAGAHAAAHQHPHQQFVWVISGAVRLRIGAKEQTIAPATSPSFPVGSTEAFFPEDRRPTSPPVREDFFTREVPHAMAPL